MGSKGVETIERTRRIPKTSAVCSVARSFGVEPEELYHVSDCLTTMLEIKIEEDSR